MIENVRYNLLGDILALVDGVELLIPDNPSNRHRQMIANWESQGNTITPAITPEQVIPNLAPRQFELMLRQIDLSPSDIEEQIATFPDEDDREIALIEYRRASYFTIDHWAVPLIAEALNIPREQLKSLWLYATEL